MSTQGEAINDRHAAALGGRDLVAELPRPLQIAHDFDERLERRVTSRGDVVRIAECRPMSRTKRFEVLVETAQPAGAEP